MAGDLRTVPLKARIALRLWHLVGVRILDAAAPAMAVEEDWDGEYIGPHDPDPALVDAVWDDGFERGYRKGRADPYDVGF